MNEVDYKEAFFESATTDDLFFYLHGKGFIFNIEVFNNKETVLYKATIRDQQFHGGQFVFTTESVSLKAFFVELFNRINQEKAHRREVIKNFELMMQKQTEADRQAMKELISKTIRDDRDLLKEVMKEIAAEIRSEKTKP